MCNFKLNGYNLEVHKEEIEYVNGTILPMIQKLNR